MPNDRSPLDLSSHGVDCRSGVPVEILEIVVNVLRTVRTVINEVGVLIYVEDQQGNGSPDTALVVSITGVGIELGFVRVPGEHGPAARGHTTGLEVLQKIFERPIALANSVSERADGVALTTEHVKVVLVEVNAINRKRLPALQGSKL